nr:hypothetical protein Iba_chr08cCG4390 [Ipomoea batatas]
MFAMVNRLSFRIEVGVFTVRKRVLVSCFGVYVFELRNFLLKTEAASQKLPAIMSFKSFGFWLLLWISRSIYSFIVLSSPSMETSSLAASTFGCKRSTRVFRSPTSQDLRRGSVDPLVASSLEAEIDLQHRRSGAKEDDDDKSSVALLRRALHMPFPAGFSISAAGTIGRRQGGRRRVWIGEIIKVGVAKLPNCP